MADVVAMQELNEQQATAVRTLHDFFRLHVPLGVEYFPDRVEDAILRVPGALPHLLSPPSALADMPTLTIAGHPPAPHRRGLRAHLLRRLGLARTVCLRLLVPEGPELQRHDGIAYIAACRGQ
jgi:hypothetical protein